MWPGTVSVAVSGAVWRDGVFSCEQLDGLARVGVCVLPWSHSHPDVWWDHWRRERGQRKPSQSWWKRIQLLELYPRIQPLSWRNLLCSLEMEKLSSCVRRVFPRINYCFLITAFPLLANLLYLDLHWWLIKFQSRWLQSSRWFPPARYGWVWAGQAEKGTINSVSWEQAAFLVWCDSTSKKLESPFLW